MFPAFKEPFARILCLVHDAIMYSGCDWTFCFPCVQGMPHAFRASKLVHLHVDSVLMHAALSHWSSWWCAAEKGQVFVHDL